uniref:Uncharacterized protein n=1 Tax=Branchiostoma floridae TaxID=7739 RepID=C3Y833_BRAFL|eukprot:XP_002607492.1 hypothetical protein BRAFLDRAFT_119254 [Branchiostoma floridae]
MVSYTDSLKSLYGIPEIARVLQAHAAKFKDEPPRWTTAAEIETVARHLVQTYPGLGVGGVDGKDVHFIYIQQHPQHRPHLVLYLHLIRDLASRRAQWAKYDEQFRYHRETSPDTPWNTSHLQLYVDALQIRPRPPIPASRPAGAERTPKHPEKYLPGGVLLGQRMRPGVAGAASLRTATPGSRVPKAAVGRRSGTGDSGTVVSDSKGGNFTDLV